MKRTYTIDELADMNDHMMNYTVSVKYFGVETAFKVHVGLKGNHLDIIKVLVKKQFGNKAEVLKAKVVGKIWKEVDPF
jgi:hypothetical protein